VVSPGFMSSQLVVTFAVTVLDTHFGFHENPKAGDGTRSRDVQLGKLHVERKQRTYAFKALIQGYRSH
jgi:hypothetical protein